MPLCDICHKNISTIHLLQIENEKKMEFHVCEECAKKQAIPAIVPGSLQDALASILEEEEKKGPSAKETRCPICNSTYSIIKAKKRLGCGYDYDLFHEEIEPIIEKIHGSAKHIGKVITKTGKDVKDVIESQKIKVEIERLKIKLNELAKEERYEEAAEVKKQIQSLEKKLEAYGNK